MKLEDYELGGTNLKSSDFKKGKVLTTEWEPDLRYAWDDGVAIGRYLAELKKEKIIRSKMSGRGFCSGERQLTRWIL